ncbi:MAG TPA: universal stress protein, partial [Blastocatellia bacterium]
SNSRMVRLAGLEARARIRRLGETFISVLQHSDIPVLLVKGEKTDIERVLICTAAGEPGKNDVIVGGRLAQRLGALPTLLHVTRDRDDPNVTRRHLDRAVAALRALDLEGDARVRRSATAASGILEEAREKNHDLIVLGSYGPRSKAFFDLNKVMLQVASDADRSVLVVPTDRV